MTNEIIERRKQHGTSEVLELVRIIHDNQISMDAKLSKHMQEETLELAEEINRLMNKCFPGGDGAGHKVAHDLWIERVSESRDFWKTMRKELAKWGLIGFLGWAAYALWTAFLQGPHK